MTKRSCRRGAPNPAFFIGATIVAAAVIIVSIALGVGIAPEVSIFAGP